MSKAVKERTKVVARSLPPALTEDAFRKAVDKHCEGVYDWFSYFQGKIRSAPACTVDPRIALGPPDSMLQAGIPPPPPASCLPPSSASCGKLWQAER
jgi:hypothetical protein